MMFEAYGMPKFQDGTVVHLDGTPESWSQLKLVWNHDNLIVTLDGDGTLGEEANSVFESEIAKLSFPEDAFGIEMINAFVEIFKETVDSVS